MNHPSQIRQSTTANGPLSRWRRTAAAILVFLATGAAVAVTAAPAQAAAPRCDTHGWRWGYNSSTIRTPVADNHVAYGEFRCSLNQGNSGKGVVALQQDIAFCYGGNTTTGYDLGSDMDLNPDGSFGPATRRALVKVQQKHGISADGGYGPQTATTMLHYGQAWTPYGYHYICQTLASAGWN